MSVQICPFLTNYCSFLRQQKLSCLAFIDRLKHPEYSLTLILEKFSCLSHDFSQFYEERYVKFSIFDNRLIFLFFKCIEILFNKHA